MKLYYDVINAILTQKKILPALKKLNKDSFRGYREPYEVYKFIQEYYTEYQELPTPELVNNNFPFFEYREVFEKVEKYVEIVNRHRYQEDYEALMMHMHHQMESLSNGIVTPKSLQRKMMSKIEELNKYITQGNSTVDVSKGADKFEERQLLKRDNKNKGLRTYVTALDKNIRLLPGHLIYMFGRPGCGKTWLSLRMMMKMFEDGLKPMFLSYEMSVEEIEERLMCIKAKVNYTRLIFGIQEEAEFNKTIEARREWDKYKNKILVRRPIDEDVTHIESIIMEEEPDVVFIDYIDLIPDTKEFSDTKAAIAYKSRYIKAMAARRGIPIVVITHSSRMSSVKSFRYQENDPEKELEKQLELNVLTPELETIANADECGKDADLVLGLVGQEVRDRDSESVLYKDIVIGTAKGRFFKNSKARMMMNLDEGLFKEMSFPTKKKPGEIRIKTSTLSSSANNYSYNEEKRDDLPNEDDITYLDSNLKELKDKEIECLDNIKKSDKEIECSDDDIEAAEKYLDME